jgi:hypothetical protein
VENTRRQLHSLLAIAACAFLLHAADAGGVWHGQLVMTGARGEMRNDATLTLALNGSKLTGPMTVNGDTGEILNGTLRGNEVSFAVASGASDVPSFEFRGNVDGDELKLTVYGELKDTGQVLTIGSASFKRSK